MYEENIREKFNNCPVGKGLGITISDLREGFARGSITLKQEHFNVFGSVHGGILFTFADHVGGACGNTLGKKALLVESSIQYLKPLTTPTTIFAEATITHTSRRIGRIDIRITGDKKDLVAVMHMVFFITKDDHEDKAS